MRDVEYGEAVELLATEKVCEGIPDWSSRDQHGQITYETNCGLLDNDGISIEMTVQLKVHKSKKTGITSFIFGLFRDNPIYGPERAYMLEVKQSIKRLTKHDQPHEHIGDRRNDIERNTPMSFNEALDIFTKRTNIEFDPEIINPGEGPENFKLR